MWQSRFFNFYAYNAFTYACVHYYSFIFLVTCICVLNCSILLMDMTVQHSVKHGNLWKFSVRECLRVHNYVLAKFILSPVISLVF